MIPQSAADALDRFQLQQRANMMTELVPTAEFEALIYVEATTRARPIQAIEKP